MPELPDVMSYVDALRPRALGRTITRVRVVSPFVLRSVEPPIDAAEGRTVRDVTRLGKRVLLALDQDLVLAVHPMIAGRFRWSDDHPPPGATPGGKIALATILFDRGALTLTEASAKKRAAIHLLAGHDALDRGGLDVLAAGRDAFGAALAREPHTLKRALTDPRLFDGIGNAYSDEILHAARLSPFKRTTDLTDEEITSLHAAARATLSHWIDQLRREFRHGEVFPGPGKITAFRPGFAVHGKYDHPCPVCATRVQRIVYAENETNYCPTCQTEGRVLADRSLSRLLRSDWPRTVDDLE